MTTKLLTTDIWPTLTAAAKKSGSSNVAVAYFGSSGSTLLPLSEGSRLVVDASDQTVKCGQTNPHELAKMLKKGVRVYSLPNLHAKIFVFGRSAYIGSTNVSKHSEGILVEAVIRTTDPEAVSSAKRFIVSLCVNPVGPRSIDRLKRLYRPPRFLSGRHRKTVLPFDPINDCSVGGGRRPGGLRRHRGNWRPNSKGQNHKC